MNFEKNRIPDIEARYRGALEKKTLFENALKNAERARNEERYKDAVKILRDYKGHPDANELYVDCLERYSSYYWAFGRKFAFGVLLIYALVLIGSIGMTVGEFSYGERFWYIPHFMVCAFSVICLHARAMYEKLKYKNDRISVMPDKLLDTLLHTVLPLTTLVPVISSAVYFGGWNAFMDGFFAVSPAFVYFIVYYSLTRKLRIRRVKEPLMWVLAWSLFCVCTVDGFPLGFLFEFANEGIYFGEFSVYQHHYCRKNQLCKSNRHRISCEKLGQWEIPHDVAHRKVHQDQQKSQRIHQATQKFRRFCVFQRIIGGSSFGLCGIARTFGRSTVACIGYRFDDRFIRCTSRDAH